MKTLAGGGRWERPLVTQPFLGIGFHGMLGILLPHFDRPSRLLLLPQVGFLLDINFIIIALIIVFEKLVSSKIVNSLAFLKCSESKVQW